MKRIIIVTILLLGTIITLQQVNFSKKNVQLTELMRVNIECLATSENINVRCFGIGSVDCPLFNYQVIYYI